MVWFVVRDHRGCVFYKSATNSLGDFNFAYSTDLSENLTRQLDRLTSHNAHQIAGQAAVLEFWIAETRHCLSVLGDYPRRFEQMATAQARHVDLHDTKLPTDICPGCSCCGFRLESPPPPTRIPDREFKSARRGLCGAFRRFIDRVYYERLIDEDALRNAYAVIGIVDGCGLPEQSPTAEPPLPD